MNTPEKLIKRGARIVGAVGLFISSIASPIDSPKEVKAESNLQQQSSLTLLHGNGSKDRLNIMLLSYNGTTPKMLQEVAEDIFLIPPTDEFKNRTNVYTTNPVENLNCNQQAICNWTAINRESKRIMDTTGIIPHKTLVVIKSFENYGNGHALIAPHTLLPSFETSSAVVRPEMVINAFRPHVARDIAHELWGHAFAGFDHEGADIMERKSEGFNPQHTQFLRAHMALSPYNYVTPKNEIKVTVGSLNFQAELILPASTTQVRHIITPFNNDGPGADLIRNPESNIKIPAPPTWYGLLPDMTYTWQMRSSGVSVPLLKDDLRWTQFEGWPGIWFPNPPAEIKIHTPKRDSSGITLLTSGETNDLTPILKWNNRDTDVFYYEVQVSKDSQFGPNAFLYHELRHGGVTNPNNSYTVPDKFPLEKGTEYFWRVRPRIQGDGTPVSWSNPQTFKTTSDARVLSESELEVIKNIEVYDWEGIQKDYWMGIVEAIQNRP